MWAQYDENLNENTFFRDIQTNHTDIISRASEENWIICIPRAGLFKSEPELSVDVVLDHVLIHGLDNNYCTLSKKQVVVKNKFLYTDTVYFQGGTEILFEEIFYVNKTSKYTVWCTDQPLFVSYKYCDSHKTRVLEDLSDCIDFLWAESLGHSLINDIKLLVEKFNKKHHLGSESLQTVKEYVGELYSQCLQLGLKRDIMMEKSMNSNAFLESFKLSTETYMQHCLGRTLMFAVNSSQYQSDAYLNKLIKNSVDIELENLGISPKFSDVFNAAKRELGKINSFNTILDKINCLKKTFNTIYVKCSELKMQIDSDILLELLVYLIIKSNINNWMTNIIFMKEFRLSLLDNSDQYSFCITNMEAATEYIKSNHFLDIKRHINKYDPSYSTVHLFSEKISSGELKMNICSLSERNRSESSLCHPLCNCDNCQKCLDSNENDTGHQIISKADENMLINAAKWGYCDVVEYLLKKVNCNVNTRDSLNKSCLHYAAAKGYQDILLLSITCNANVNAADKDKNTPLHLACMNGHDNCVKALMYSTSEVELNIGNIFGETPLHLATKCGFLDIIKILLENGASLIIENKQRQTVVSLAPNYYVLKLFEHYGSKNSYKFYKELKQNKIPSKQEKQVQLEHCKDHGIRPKDIEQYKKIDLLLKAIEINDFPLACFHLGFTSNSLKTTKRVGCHPLCRCEKCHSEYESENENLNVFHNPVNINMCNVNGYTPLHIAAKYGRTDILRLLLDSGAFPNVKTYKTLYTPLHLACINQRVQTVRELLKCGNCKVDESDSEGNTSLFYAVSNNDMKTVEMLIFNGADCTKKNYVDRSPLQESEVKMHYRVFRILKNSLSNILEKYPYSNSAANELFGF